MLRSYDFAARRHGRMIEICWAADAISATLAPDEVNTRTRALTTRANFTLTFKDDMANKLSLARPLFPRFF